MDALKYIKRSDEVFMRGPLKGLTMLESLSKAGIIITVTGIFTMEFFHILSNIGIILLTLSSLFYLLIKRADFNSLISQRSLLPFFLIFIMFLGSFLLTDKENIGYVFKQIELKILYVVLPFSFAILPVFEKRFYHHIYFLFFILVILSSIPSAVFYFLNHEEVIYNYSRSGVIPTPVNHIRYSLMICYAIFLGTYLFFKNYANKTIWINFLLIGGTLFLIFFIHLLAVRSGLISFYILLLLASVYLALHKKYIATLLLFIFIAFLISISYLYIDTIKTKWGYTLYDIEQSSNKESSNNYSLSRRFLSNEIGYKIFKNNPIFGIGEANIKAAIHQSYKEDHPYILPQNIIMTHNQYLRVLAATGIVGFLIFHCCFYYPLFFQKNYKFLPLFCIYLILSLSFLVEDTLYTQLGFIFGLFFITINIHYLKGYSKKTLD